MSGRSTHYDVLGVGERTSAADIRAAYLALARRHHPDGGVEADTARMARINEAWAVLGDPGRRHAYDEGLAAARPPVAPRPDAPPWRPYDPGSPSGSPLPPEDVAVPSAARRALTMTPAVLTVGAIAAFSVGLVTGLGSLLALGVLLALAAGASFVLAPVITMIESSRNDPDRPR